MAEALLSKEHFYLNASQYNSGTTDIEATIHVQDTTGILKTNSDWLVHVTRFSCDTMTSLAYVEKDETAKWEIRVVDDTARIHEVFNFVLSEDYATPQALIAAMNLNARWITRQNIEYEVFRWQIDANGKFKLTSMSEEAIPDSHITYSGTPSMNTLLGLQNVTPFLSYQKSPSLVYADFADWFHDSLVTSYKKHGDSFRLRNMTRKCIIHFLNGFQCNHYNAAKTETYFFEPHHLAQDIEYRTLSIVDKGLARSSSNSEREAILPKTNIPVLCEWYAEYHAQTNFDNGFFASTSLLKYPNAYAPETGQAEFFDMQTGNSKIAPCAFPQYWPVHEAQSHSNLPFDRDSTFLPLDSLFGYVFSGTDNVLNPTGSFVVDHLGMPADPRVFHFSNPLPSYAVVGDDIWIQQSFVMAGGGATPAAWSTHQIEEISPARDIAVVDFPLGQRTVASAQFTQTNAILTNRRFPFQSRSAQWWGMQQLAAVSNGHSIIMDQATNGSPGDELIFISAFGDRLLGSNTITERNWHPEGSHIHDDNQVNAYEELVIEGDLPAGLTGINWLSAGTWANYRILIIKKAGDLVRWAIDKENLKLSSTTFSYDGVPYVAARRESKVDVQGLSYLPDRYEQTYNKTMLRRQIQKSLDVIEQEYLFRDFARPCATTTITEKLTEETIRTMNFQHIVNRVGRFVETVWGITVENTESGRSVTYPYSNGVMADYILPTPWWTHRMWDIVHAGEAVFVEANQYDKPHLQHQRALSWRNSEATNNVQYFHEPEVGSGGVGDQHGALQWSTTATGFLQMAPIICGVRQDVLDRKSFVVWSPYRPIGDTSKGETLVSPMRWQNLERNVENPARFSVSNATYDLSTRAYAIAKKEMKFTTLSEFYPAKVYGADGDYIASALHSHIDLVFPFKQLVLTSDDLNQLPEKTQDSGGMKPILSSYTLPSMWPVSVDKEGKPSGGESSPFGTVYFSETGARRFHHLTPVPGGLRQFTVNAALTYKDDTRTVKRVILPPGGSFNAQLLFIRKVNE